MACLFYVPVPLSWRFIQTTDNKIHAQKRKRKKEKISHAAFYYADAKQSALEIGTSLFVFVCLFVCFFLHGSRK